MQVILHGHIVSPIVTNETTFQFEGAECTIINPYKVIVGKLEEFKGQYEETELEKLGSPDPVIAYDGELEVRFECATKEEGERKLAELFQIDAIGPLTSMGMGRVDWKEGKFVKKPNRK